MTAVLLLEPGEATPGNPKWHELRRAAISASEIAAVLGISPWESPFSLYWRKVEGWDVEANAEMSAGTRAEPVVANWFADMHRVGVTCPAGLYAHPDRPWQLATPDRLVCDPQMHDNPFPDDPTYLYDHHTDAVTMAVLECKYLVHGWDGWGEPGTDDIPVHYRAQVLWQMDVLDVDTGYVAAWHGAEFRCYEIRRDERDLRVMREHGRRFMDRLTAQDPPPLDDHTATLAAVKRLHPSVDDIDVEVPAEFAEGYRRARAARARAEALVDRYEARARQMLGNGRRLMCGKRLVCSRSVYDQTGDMAELDSLDTDPSTVDRLNPGRAASYVN